MPESNERAASELLKLRKDRGVTARSIAESLSKSEAWVSRRLNGAIELKVNDYNRIKEAIASLADDTSKS